MELLIIIIMTYETLLEQLQLLNPHQLKQNVLIYDKVEEKFYPPEHHLSYNIDNNSIAKDHPYFAF
tara:strand:- start:387 stop:584 length:198 start_codon:yes stop_codon:yes gene_type:complete